MGPGHTITMSGQGLLLLAVNWSCDPLLSLQASNTGRSHQSSTAMKRR